ncbi:hypothetical protein BK120_26080 [Paenibacillus sp. FSL A5-0031]|uniref:DUF4855 domain-containing protein n=1 Tax=Paenibacillus sp. FSL A5-0031 TaxID=1920420 RepID=UPI00096FD94D|nr:DUF4855 domain-containing protein [Paenibacillus sp. FSL A5-0031]OME77393.1 hypothetical protein BK120_26080 [Paenibacillus sp. FSL A5-0031]
MKTRRSLTALLLVPFMLFSLISSVYAEEAGGENADFYNVAQGKTYTWSEQPEDAFPDDGTKLTDGNAADLSRNSGNWVGHRNMKSRSVVFDLGEQKTIQEVNARFLHDWPNNETLVPLTVSFYVSDDEVNWGVLSHNATKLLWGDQTDIETFTWDGSTETGAVKRGDYTEGLVYARYVKVVFSMHPRAWSMIDEVTIIGADGLIVGAEPVQPEPYGLQQSGDATGGIQNLGLLYNGHYPDGKGTWTKERVIPNISYVNKQGEPVDWLFDGVLYLGLTSENGRGFGATEASGKARKEEWEWYLNKTFNAGGDMSALNEATVEVGAKLGEPDRKTKVVLMIPDPGEYQSDFGSINGGNLNFNLSVVGNVASLDNRAKAIQWWTDEVKSRWSAAGYSNLELVGMYWLEEQISTHSTGPEMVKKASDIVHNAGLKMFWIPHFMAYKAFMWKDVGIDAISLQPNYFFEKQDPSRLEDTADMAKRYGMSLELEFDDRMINDAVFRERFIDYLNSGVDTGLMQQGYKAYYQGNNAVYNAAKSAEPATRVLYDWLYQFVKGTYQKQDTAPPDVVALMNGEPISEHTIVPDTTQAAFTWTIPGDDGSGIVKVTAKYDGKPYTEGTVVDLMGKPGKHVLELTVAAAKSKTVKFVIEARLGAKGLLALVDKYAVNKQLSNADTIRAMRNALIMMERTQESDPEQAIGYLLAFNAKLEGAKGLEFVTEGAYTALKEGVYYEIGSIAQDKEAEASSTEAAGLEPSKALDGATGTRWASEVRDTAWFQIDLDSKQTFNTIRIDWEYARADQYRLSVSDDKQTWEPLKVGNNGVVKASDGKNTLVFPATTARYIKFEGLNRATFYGYSFYEFGVYDLAQQQVLKSLDGIQAAVDASTKKVTIDGLVMNGKKEHLYVKVLDPKGNIQYTGQTGTEDDGSFRIAFTLTGEEQGLYMVELETDNMTTAEQAVFEYRKPPSTGGGNGGSIGGGPAQDPYTLQADGSVKAVFVPTLKGNQAAASVREADLNAAIRKATADSNGNKHIRLELKPSNAAGSYVLELPAANLTNQSNLILHISTPHAQLALTGDMLAGVKVNAGKLLVIVSDHAGEYRGNEAAGRIGNRPIVEIALQLDGKALSWNNAKAPISIAIPYSLQAGEQAADLQAFKLTGNSAAAIDGASYDKDKSVLRFSIDQVGVFAAGGKKPAAFTDLGKHEWAREAIEKLAEKGIVKGTSIENGTFSPANQVTRADFILMLVNMLALRAEITSTFADVKPNDYYYDAVSIAMQLGIVSGVNEVNFGPRDSISRQDTMVMLTRALQTTGAIKPSASGSTLEGFRDASQIAPYAADSVATMLEHGLVTGSNGYMKPKSTTSRAEAATFLYRVLQLIEGQQQE